MADPLNVAGAFLEMTQRLMSDPGRWSRRSSRCGRII